MDRRKAEAQGQLQTLKQECEITAELFNRLVQVCSNRVKDIEKLDSKSFRKYSKYFLAVLQFQSVSIQKIIEWNIDLEEFLTENEPADLEHFRIINSTNHSSISLSECEIGSGSISPNSCSSFVPYTTKTKSVLDINITDVEIKANPKNNIDEANISTNAEIITSEVEENTEKPITDVKPLKLHTEVEENNVLHSEYYDNNKSLEALSESPSTDETIIADNVDFPTPCNALNDSISSSEYFYSVSSLNGDKNSAETDSEDLSSCVESSDLEETQIEKPKATPTSSSEYFRSVSSLNGDRNLPEADLEDVSSYAEFSSDFEEKPKQSSITSISERLKTLPVVSLQDRFLESLPKPRMPDLSLRPVSELLTSKHNENKQLDVPVTNSLTLENIKAFESEHDKIVTKSKVKKKTKATEFQEFKNATDYLEIEERPAPKLGDICMIGYVESPSEIYIQVVDENSSSLDVLSMQLSELYRNSYFVFASKTDAINRMGNFWTFCSGGGCYRAEVLDWMLNDKQGMVLVQLVDYGWKYMVPYQELQPLPLEMRNLPRMAQLCHLGYLYPSGSTINRRLRKWSEEENNGFYEVLGDLNLTAFRIAHAYYCKERKSYEVDLIKTDEENEESTIGQILCDRGLAVQIFDDHSAFLNNAMRDQIRTAHGINGITSDMSIDDILETYFQQNVDEEATTLNEAVMHYDAKDEAETCRNLRPDGTCYKGKSCKLRHIPLRNGFTRDKIPVYDKAFEEDPLPCIDDEVFVTISHVVDIRCFYAQIRRDSQLAGYPIAGRTLNSLIKTMNNPDIVKTYQKLQLPPSPCQMVIAKHWNSFWYRGQVRDTLIPEDNNNIMVEVYIVDFGDTLEVPMSDLRIITSDFLFMSFQAVECRLYNVKHKDGLDPIEERKHFERQYLGQNFKAKIMGVPGYLEVVLENDNGEDIGLKLIEDGCGELNTDHFFPANNEHILID